VNRLELATQQPIYEYETVDGELVSRHSVNRHHIAWQKRSYTTRTESLYRNMSGMVIPMLIPAHNDLHAHIRPPRKPTLNLIRHAISFNEATGGTGFDQFEQMIEFFADVADTSRSPQEARDAQSIASNFMSQHRFIEKARVVKLDFRR